MPGRRSFAGWLARRFVLLLFTLVFVPSVSFVLFALIDGETGPLEILRDLAHYLAATFLHAQLGSGDFAGQDFRRNQDALTLILDGLPADAYLLAGGLVSGVVLGLLGGVVMAERRHSPGGRAVYVGTAFILSSPVYWLGFVVLILIGPGTGSLAQLPFVSGVGAYEAPADDLLAFVRSLWVPALICGAPLAAMCARMCASTLTDAMGQEFVRVARSKGLRERRVVARHALPVATPAVLAIVGANMNLMITNVALMEAVFNVPGTFRFFQRALVSRDVDLVQAMVLEATALIVVANFAVDAIQAWLDPRIR